MIVPYTFLIGRFGGGGLSIFAFSSSGIGGVLGGGGFLLALLRAGGFRSVVDSTHSQLIG